jgi:hydroxyacylglutathione hydrolase
VKLTEDLFTYVYQGKDNNCNSYLIANTLSESRHVLIDPGHVTTGYYREPGLDRLLQSMTMDGIKPESIGLVILTHAHTDHCEAATHFRQMGAKVALHKDDEYLYQRLGGEPDVYLDEGTLELGTSVVNNIQVLHVPGHSPGHIALYWVERKALFVGDVIFYRSTGRVDLPGGSTSEMRRSIQRLSELDAEYLLCGHPYGHPGVIKGKEAIAQNFDFIKRNVI